MRLQFENVNFDSRSGPNNFGSKLAKQLQKMNVIITNDSPDVRLAFIQSSCNYSPTVLRLDGIYFNSSQNWKRLNDPIKKSYNFAKSIIAQSEFNKELIIKYFGYRDDINVINNGTDLELISELSPAKIENIDQDKEIWLCASSWRPHKRLNENIRYFYEFAPKNAIMLVAGSNPDLDIKSMDRIIYLGDLSWYQLISVMKRATTFVHLSWLDHCPNVVVDARACGCKIICSSSGGTKEIAGDNSVIINEDSWDFRPLELYKPTSLDFSKAVSNKNITKNIDIIDVAKKYKAVLGVACGFN
jgi:glycosyltransferase involved in cell wall biosynthesis